MSQPTTHRPPEPPGRRRPTRQPQPQLEDYNNTKRPFALAMAACAIQSPLLIPLEGVGRVFSPACQKNQEMSVCTRTGGWAETFVCPRTYTRVCPWVDTANHIISCLIFTQQSRSSPTTSTKPSFTVDSHVHQCQHNIWSS